MKYIFFLFLFSYTLIYSQDDFVTIKFQNLELLESGWKGARFSFKINGLEIQPDTLEHKIWINKRKFDNVIFSMNDNFNDKMVFTKFRKNESYVIRINTCSQYELLPENSAKMGSVEFFSEDKSDNFNLEFCVESILFNKNNSHKPKKCIPSAMCYFSKKEIKILENEELLDSFYFHFLHGEKLFLKFSKGKLNFKIKE